MHGIFIIWVNHSDLVENKAYWTRILPINFVVLLKLNLRIYLLSSSLYVLYAESKFYVQTKIGRLTLYTSQSLLL